MRRVVKLVTVAIAALLLSANVKAQDLNEIIDLFNKANQEVKGKKYDQALANINKTYEMATTIGDAEGEELASIKNSCEKLLVNIPYLQGKDYFAAKEYEKAIEKLTATRAAAEKYGNKSIQAEATALLPQIYAAKGTDLVANNDFANAIEAFKQSLALNPNNAEAHILSASAYDKLGEEANSISSYEKAIEVAKATGDEASMQKASAELAVIFVKKAQAAMQAKRTDEAIINLEKASSLNNNPEQQPDIDYYLATQYDAKGNKAKACASYKKAAASPKHKANAEARIKALGC